MAGHRRQYLHPIKMYIFISIAYFFVLFQSSFENTRVMRHKDNAVKKTTTEQLMPVTVKDASYKAYLASQDKLPAAKRDGFFIKMYNRRAFSFKERYGSSADEVFIDQFKHNVPKMMFLMLPLCALIIRIAFRKNSKYYVAHLIFSFHLHCFLFLFLTVIMLLQLLLPASWRLIGWLNFTAAVVIIWYIYRSLRIVYHRTHFRTISKMTGMSLSYFFVFVFCMSIAFLFTAVTILN